MKPTNTKFAPVALRPTDWSVFDAPAKVEPLAIENPVEVSDARAAVLVVARDNGATLDELNTIARAGKAGIRHVRVTTRFGGLSRGKSYGRQGRGDNAVWAERDGSTVLLTAGKWTVGSNDGFSRKEATDYTVRVVAGVLVID